MTFISNRFKRVFSWTIISLGMAAIIWLVMRGWHEIETALTDVRWALFASSVAIGISGTAVIGGVFHVLMRKYGFAISALDSQKLMFYGQIVKYVPGKVWPILYQANTVREEGRQAIKGTAAANLDLMLVSLVSTTALGIALLLLPEHYVLSLFVAGAGCWFTVFSITRCLLSETVRWFRTWARVRWTKIDVACIRAKANVTLVVYCVALFLLPVAAYFCMLDAVFHLSPTESIAVTAYLLLAWAASTLTLVVPAGLGVKEIIFVGLGTIWGDASAEKLIAIAVVSRFWQILQDVGGAIVLFVILRAHGK